MRIVHVVYLVLLQQCIFICTFVQLYKGNKEEKVHNTTLWYSENHIIVHVTCLPCSEVCFVYFKILY